MVLPSATESENEPVLTGRERLSPITVALAAPMQGSEKVAVEVAFSAEPATT